MTISAYNIEYDKFPKDFLLEFFRNDSENIIDYDIPDYLKKEQPDLVGVEGGNVIKGFKVDCHNYFNEVLRPIGEEFCEHYNIKNKFITHFLCVEPGTSVGWHADGGDVMCAVNFLLEGDENCPIEFEDGFHTYNLALLDVTSRHRVSNNTDMQRIMFRLSFMDGTYEDIKNKCLRVTE